MATIYGPKSSTGWYLKIDYSISQSVANNTSTIYIDLSVYNGTGNSYNQMPNQAYYTIMGYKTYATYNFPSKGWYSLGSDSVTVSHNSDGTGSVTLSASWYSSVNSNYTPSSLSISETISLPTIAREASKVSCTTAYIGGDAATITINRASSSFRHTLSYTFGGLSGTIVTKTSSTSVSFSLPTDFYAEMPNQQSKTGTITCDTYSGSSLVGTTTCTFVAKTNESQCYPTLSDSAYDENQTTVALTGNNQKMIKYFSNAHVKTNAKARYSATLVAQSITCGDASVDGGEGVIENVESGTFVYSATDSRGYTNRYTVIHTLIEYIKLTCAMEAGAPSASGVAQLNVSGNYWNGNFGAVDNTLTIQYRYKVKGSTYGDWIDSTAEITKADNKYNTTITISGLDNTKAYTFQARAIDKLINTGTDEQTNSNKPIFDWGKNDFNINGTLNIKNVNIFDLMYPVGSIYISVNSTNPKTLFGGTWSRIQDTFLLAAGTVYSAGSTGGEAEHTLTVDEMPSHGHSGSTNRTGSHYHSFAGRSSNGSYGPSAESFASSDDARTIYTENAGIHSHTVTIDNTGGDGAHNNMPPYLAVYVWERTS